MGIEEKKWRKRDGGKGMEEKWEKQGWRRIKGKKPGVEEGEKNEEDEEKDEEEGTVVWQCQQGSPLTPNPSLLPLGNLLRLKAPFGITFPKIPQRPFGLIPKSLETPISV